jgi:hypothetical protein
MNCGEGGSTMQTYWETGQWDYEMNGGLGVQPTACELLKRLRAPSQHIPHSPALSQWYIWFTVAWRLRALSPSAADDSMSTISSLLQNVYSGAQSERLNPAGWLLGSFCFLLQVQNSILFLLPPLFNASRDTTHLGCLLPLMYRLEGEGISGARVPVQPIGHNVLGPIAPVPVCKER